MGLFKQKPIDGNLTIEMLHSEGLPCPAKVPYKLILDESGGKLIFRTNPKYITGGPSEVTLSIDKIVSTERVTEKKYTTKSGHPIARAAVGGALFGAAGAVVGAVSGEKEKTKKEVIFYRKINYISDGQEKILFFRFAGDKNEPEFFNRLNALINPSFNNISVEL